MSKNIDQIRKELITIIKKQLTPLAKNLGYTNTPLESKINWKPIVLILGNYSSGKSSLINDLIGQDIQTTGQAPTDDSFTVITNQDDDENNILDGKTVLNDPKYPFQNFKKHGEKFSSHFRLKKVNSDFLKDIAIIDTPGMIDNVTEHNRGYDYQEVIGEFAKISDLVLILFDPHKAGTIKETYVGLRDTLPNKTFEDRILFVLNRADECVSLNDLVRVYGTLCWNLSQMTGRKDMPPIYLTYLKDEKDAIEKNEFIKYLDNQRQELKSLIACAPKKRIDNLINFLIFHSERMELMLNTLLNFVNKSNHYRNKWNVVGLFFSALLTGVIYFYFIKIIKNYIPYGIYTDIGFLSAVFVLIFTKWVIFIQNPVVKIYKNKLLKNIDKISNAKNQYQKEIWNAMKDYLINYIKKLNLTISKSYLKKGKNTIKRLQKKSKTIKSKFND